MHLRQYQINLINKLRDKFQQGKRRLICYGPTGMGKTEIAMAMIDGAISKGKKSLFIANRVELINQASRRFNSHGLDHGVIQADHPLTDPRKQIQICSIQTLNRRRLPEADFIVIDEAHGATAESYQKILKAYNNVPTVGLTATPFSRGLGKKYDELKTGLFEDIVIEVKTTDLIQSGHLVDCKIYAPSKPDLEKVKVIRGDYDEGELNDAVNTPYLIGEIVAHWKRLAENRKTIIFATSIAHSKNIVEQFISAGVKADHIDAYTKDEDRTAILNRLRNGEIDIISNVALLAEGFDLPDLGCMVLARPTKSLARYIQMVGRVLRPAQGKEFALILDHSGVVESLGFPTDELPLWLDDGTPRKKSQTESKPKLPKVCPSCSFVKPPLIHKCPICGFAPDKRPNVEVVDGKLEVKTRKDYPIEEKQKLYSELLGHAQEKGYKKGWAYHKYKDLVGCYPASSFTQRPLTPSVETLNLIKYLNIKNAKRREKKKIQCPKCKASDYRISKGTGPHAKRADCNKCGAMWWLAKGVA